MTINMGMSSRGYYPEVVAREAESYLFRIGAQRPLRRMKGKG
jgi:hypothetical protein